MIERTIKKHKSESVADLINQWNAVRQFLYHSSVRLG